MITSVQAQKDMYLPKEVLTWFSYLVI